MLPKLDKNKVLNKGDALANFTTQLAELIDPVGSNN